MFNFIILIFKNGFINYNKIIKLLLFLLLKLALIPLVSLESFLLNKKIKAHHMVHSPIFIIGHWRSGTTLLHQLISQDSNKAYLNFYQATFSGFFILTEKYLKPLLQRLATSLNIKIPYFNNIDFDWDFPCEEDTALLNMNSKSSAYWGYVFPKASENWFAQTMFFNNSSFKLEENWKRDYQYLIKKLSYYNKGKQLILKSPPNTGRIKQILELFPNAKFIHINRNSNEIFNSHKKLWKANNKNFALQTISNEDLERIIISTFKNLTQKYATERALIPESNLYELQYHALKTNTQIELANIYQYLKLDNYLNSKSYFNKFISEQKYQTFNYDNDSKICM
jgi:hypothetical protein